MTAWAAAFPGASILVAEPVRLAQEHATAKDAMEPPGKEDDRAREGQGSAHTPEQHRNQKKHEACEESRHSLLPQRVALELALVHVRLVSSASPVLSARERFRLPHDQRLAGSASEHLLRDGAEEPTAKWIQARAPKHDQLYPISLCQQQNLFRWVARYDLRRQLDANGMRAGDELRKDGGETSLSRLEGLVHVRNECGFRDRNDGHGDDPCPSSAGDGESLVKRVACPL
jgi:hypothetical protein